MTVERPQAQRIREVKAADELRSQALLQHDLAAIAAMLAPEYSHTHANGKIEDLDAYLGFLAGPVRYRSIEHTEVSIRLYADVAVVICVLQLTVLPNAGAAPMSFTFRVQQVWHEHEAGWRLCAYQATMLSQDR